MPDPHGLLRETGPTARSVRISEQADYDKRVADLLDTAISLWPWDFDPDRASTTTVVSVSDKRRPRR